MSSLYNDFEKRFTDKWFSLGWQEVEPESKDSMLLHKDLTILESELENLKEEVENILQKRLRLANLAKLYNN